MPSGRVGKTGLRTMPSHQRKQAPNPRHRTRRETRKHSFLIDLIVHNYLGAAYHAHVGIGPSALLEEFGASPAT